MKLIVMLAAAGTLAVTGASPGAPAESPPDPFKSCWDKAFTTYEMRECAGLELKAADAHLNKSYKEVMCYLEPDEKAQLVAAQRAWIAFRDADCAFWGGGGGTIAPMNQALCIASVSEERAKELDGWPPNADRDALAPCNEDDSTAH